MMTRRQQDAFVLRMSGMTMKEIGEAMGFSTARAGQLVQMADERIEQVARAAEWRLHPAGWDATDDRRFFIVGGDQRVRLATWQDREYVEPRVTWYLSIAKRAAWISLAAPRFSIPGRGPRSTTVAWVSRCSSL